MTTYYMEQQKEEETSMKKWLALVAACVLAMNLLAGNCLAATGSGTVFPQYDLTKSIKSSLNISSSGMAECHGYVKSSNSTDTIDMTMDLLVKKGSQWNPYRHWAFTGAKGISDHTQTCAVESGTYKLKVTGTVTTTAGRTETVVYYSNEKTYSAHNSGIPARIPSN